MALKKGMEKHKRSNHKRSNHKRSNHKRSNPENRSKKRNNKRTKKRKHVSLSIIRTKKGKKHEYKNRKTNKIIKECNLMPHIKSMKLPPAYPMVYISADKNNSVQAIGIDSKDRKQYFYHQKIINNRKNNKFRDLVYFMRKLGNIRKDMSQVLSKCDETKTEFSKKEVIAMILYILDNCKFRIGSSKYMKLYNSFGATTLQGKHINCNKNETFIKFIGKKGVENTGKITHPKMCQLLKQLKKIYGNECLFHYGKDNIPINEKMVNDFLKMYHPILSAKMYRTYSANYEAVKGLHQLSLKNQHNEQKQQKKEVLELLRKIAEKHHHSLAIARSSYIHDDIITTYLDDVDKWNSIYNKNKGNVNRIITSYIE